MCALLNDDKGDYVTLLLPSNTGLPVPCNGPDHTAEGPRWHRTTGGIVATYTLEELEWALAVAPPAPAIEVQTCQRELMTTEPSG